MLRIMHARPTLCQLSCSPVLSRHPPLPLSTLIYFLLFMYVCVCVCCTCVYIHVCMCVCMLRAQVCACEHRGPSSVSGIFLNYSHTFFLVAGSPVPTQSLLIWLVLTCLLQGACFHLPRLGFQTHHLACLAFTWDPGSRLRPLLPRAP